MAGLKGGKYSAPSSGSGGKGGAAAPTPYTPTPIDPALGQQTLTGLTYQGQGTMPPDPAFGAGHPLSTAVGDSEAVAALAAHFNLKDNGKQSMEEQVVQYLATHYKINVKKGGGGGGTDVLGDVRHDLASAVDAPGDVLMGKMPSVNGGTPQAKSPAKAAPQGTLQAIVKKLNGDPSKDPMVAIAEKLNVPLDQRAEIPGPISGQTVAENYANFTKHFANKNGTLTDSGRAIRDQLEQAGFLDRNAVSATGYPSASAVEAAYKTMLEESVSTKLSPSQVITNRTQTNQKEAAAGGTSEAEAYIAQEAATYGISLTQDQITGLANQFSAEAGGAGLSSESDQVRAAIVKLYDPTNKANPPGLASSMAEGIQAEANAYKVPLSQDAIGQLVKNALNSGATNSTDVVAQTKLNLEQQAAGLYPTLAGQILAGNDVKTLVDPYNQVTAQYTGMPAATIDNEQNKPGANKYDAFLQGGQDPKTGAPTMMSLDQWKKKLMQDPQYGFTKTQGGQDMAEQMSMAILNELGFVTTSSPNQDISNSSYTGSPGTANT